MSYLQTFCKHDTARKPLTKRSTKSFPSVISMILMLMTHLMHPIVNPLPMLTKSTLPWPAVVAPTSLNLIALVHIKPQSWLARFPQPLIPRLSVLMMMNELIVHFNRPIFCRLLTNCETPNTITDRSKPRLTIFVIASIRLSTSVIASTWNSTSKGGWQGL
jgi:hypothetical protein